MTCAAVVCSLIPLDARVADRAALVAFLTGHEFPFHVGGRPRREQVEHAIDTGRCDGEDHAAFWVDSPPAASDWWCWTT